MPADLWAVEPDRAPGDFFLYKLDLWPTPLPQALVILKQGSNPRAG